MPDITTEFANEGIRQADRIIAEVAKLMDREKVIKESEEAIEILAKAEEPTFWIDFVRCAFENVLALLKEQEVVVRCKDCKHSKQSRFSNRFCCELSFSYNEPDWFCADGERKKGDGDDNMD